MFSQCDLLGSCSRKGHWWQMWAVHSVYCPHLLTSGNDSPEIVKKWSIKETQRYLKKKKICIHWLETVCKRIYCQLCASSITTAVIINLRPAGPIQPTEPSKLATTGFQNNLLLQFKLRNWFKALVQMTPMITDRATLRLCLGREWPSGHYFIIILYNRLLRNSQIKIFVFIFLTFF